MGIDINWGAAPAPFDPVGANIAGQTAGLDLGQRKATIHALQGIDLNNPQSVDAGIGNLVHANAMEQGNALQNLSWTRYLRSQAPDFQAKIAALGKDDGSSSAPATGGVDHVKETYQMAKDATDTLASTPAEDRPSAFATIKQNMMQRGIPEAAIDAAGHDLSDEGLASLSSHYAGLLAHAGGEGEMPGAHPSSSWSAKLLQDPALVGQIGYFAKQGLDYSSLLDTAKALEGPNIAKQAEVAAAPTLAGIKVAETVASAAGTSPINVNTAVQTEKGTLPYKVALSNAQADINARHDVIQIPEVDPKTGEPTGRVTTYRKDAALNAAAGGKPIGKAQSPADQANDVVDRTTFANNYKEDVNQPSITADKNSRDQSLVAAHMAQSAEVNPSNLTNWAARNANVLSAFGIDKKQANNLSTYQTLVAQNLKSAIQVYPKNMGEFHAIQNAVADAKSPGDAAALALTENAAIHDAAVRYKEFRRDWAAQNPNNTSEKAFQAAWAQNPAANQSMFASPVFRDLKFNGKPAVAIVPSAASDNGRVYGIFMPGTPQATKFRVK